MCTAGNLWIAQISLIWNTNVQYCFCVKCIAYSFMLQNVFLIDHHCETQTEITDLFKKAEFTEVPAGCYNGTAWCLRRVSIHGLNNWFTKGVKQILKVFLMRKNSKMVLILTFFKMVPLCMIHFAWSTLHDTVVPCVQKSYFLDRTAVKYLQHNIKLYQSYTKWRKIVQNTDPDTAEELSYDVFPWWVTFVPLRSSDEKN